MGAEREQEGDRRGRRGIAVAVVFIVVFPRRRGRRRPVDVLQLAAAPPRVDGAAGSGEDQVGVFKIRIFEGNQHLPFVYLKLTGRDASDVLRVLLADGEEAELGAAVGMEDAAHARDHLRKEENDKKGPKPTHVWRLFAPGAPSAAGCSGRRWGRGWRPGNRWQSTL